jgi:hypothetical protein
LTSAIRTIHLILLSLITRTVLGEQYESAVNNTRLQRASRVGFQQLAAARAEADILSLNVMTPYLYVVILLKIVSD